MHKSNIKSTLLALLALLLTAGPGILMAQKDIAGSKDHPIITRYPGAVIEWYEEKNFKDYHIATGPVVGYRTIDEWKDVEGKLTRIYYSIKGTRTMEEVLCELPQCPEKGRLRDPGPGNS